MSRVLGLTIAPVLLIAAAPLAAQAPAAPSAQPQAAPQKSAPDSNEIICEKQEVLGSRLAKRKVCMTRAQWADMRLQDRQEIERVQVQRGAKGE